MSSAEFMEIWMLTGWKDTNILHLSVRVAVSLLQCLDQGGVAE